jgi:VanZ family protein
MDAALLRATAFVFALALVVQLLVLPEPAFVPSITALITDKVLHALVFGLLAVLLYVLAGPRTTLAVFAAVVGIGVLDELHQAFVPGREADLADLLADAAGAAIALHLVKFVPLGAPTCAES